MSGPPPSSGYAFPGFSNLRNDIYPAISAAQTPSLKQPGKVVLVTGASRGIGRAIAIQYAHAGVAAIILVARSAGALEEVKKEIQGIDSGIKVSVKPVDVTSVEGVRGIKEEVGKEEGRLDVLVNNAGAGGDWVPLAETKPDEWWWDFEVSVKAPYLFLQAFLPLLASTAEKYGGKADVINMSSIGAHIFLPGASAYQTCKLALLRLSEFVNVEYGNKGIVCVGMHPGGVLTELAKGKVELEGKLNDTPELAGGFAVWLTAEKRDWLAGRYVAATWDVEKLESMKEEIVSGDKLVVRMVV
ncbi:NAD(P)-binding protein [Periconia macrospinosa]|uniref:NAD(P)-binding protein n=1 Tax=Periconia macrospinosa TaxID=97972 RepID=A0A2V1DBM5_9PLEO|nr:NAD(P)-binding protein [Periconia macrospinosa]